MWSVTKKICSFLLVFLLAGCSVIEKSKPILPNADSAYLQTRVYLGGCVVKAKNETSESGLLSAVANAVVPQLITKGLDSVAATLRKAGEKEVITISARHNFNVGRSIPACMQIVHGVIAPTLAGAKNGNLSVRGANSGLTDNFLKKQQIYLAAEPKLFVELRILGSQDKSSLIMAVSHVTYNSHVRGSKRRLSKDGRAISADIIFHATGVSTEDKKALKTQLLLGELSPGTHLSMIDSTVELKKWNPSMTTAWFKDFTTRPETSNGKPVTLTASVYETRSENSLLLTLADVFDSSKDVLQKELEKSLLDSKKREADIAELTAEKGLLANYYASLVSAEGAVIEYCDSTEEITPTAKKARLEASKIARLAQLQVNIDALAAGRQAPYSQSKLVNVSSDVVAAGCSG